MFSAARFCTLSARALLSSSLVCTLAVCWQVIYAVSVRKERPAMSVWCPPALAKLIRRCWAEDVKTRPSAREVVAELGGLIAAAEAQTPPEGAAPIQLTV